MPVQDISSIPVFVIFEILILASGLIVSAVWAIRHVLHAIQELIIDIRKFWAAICAPLPDPVIPNAKPKGT